MRSSLIVAGLLVATVAAAQPLRVLILSGTNNHDWRATTPAIRKLLGATGRFDIRVTETPAGLNDAALAPFDVIVADYNGPRLGAVAEKAIQSFVRNGKGLVSVHGADYGFSGLEILGDRHVPTGRREEPWPAWAEMLGGVWTEKPKTGHGNRHTFTVKWTDPNHPVARGLGESFQTDDELYHNFVLRPGVHVLATAFDAPEQKGTGRNEPVLWTNNYGQGRVFHMTLGHDTAALSTSAVSSVLARGTEWAASGAVTLPPPPPAVRVLVLTAGHDHQPSFYAFLDNDPALNVTIDPTGDFFKSDLRKRYDVVLFYNMRDDFDETRRGHLREFVESGKGVVLLHHSLASFHSWEWWWHDVAAGHYFEKTTPEHAAATYKHDIHLTATPAGDHPVLGGVGPIALFDEGYKGMWISPDVKPLLTTQHESADPLLAWVSPYAKARVVVIQPGHDKNTHDNWQWRRLVRNAILWTAGSSGT